MNTKIRIASTLFFALFLFTEAIAWADAVPTVTQTVNLKTGWNAVYLEVQPLSNSPAVVFQGLPKGASVWEWTGKNKSVQFIQDPGEAIVNSPRWLAIFADTAVSKLNTLHAINANSAFLIKIPTGNPTLTIIGRPTLKHKTWVADSFNLTGFGFSSTPPKFAAFFAPSNSHKNQAIYRLNNTSGTWEIVNDPTTVAMRSGEAFWIYCQSGSDYQGPLSIDADSADSLDFGAGITILKLNIFNWSASDDRTVLVTQLSSTIPVSLVVRDFDATSGRILTSPLSSMSPVLVKAGSSTMITLAVQREHFTGSAASVLEFTDSKGNRVRVPVTAVSSPINSYRGLWTGVASLSLVSQVSDTNPDPEAKPTTSELNLNLIFHQDRNNQVRLLKQVLMMSQEGTRNPDGTVRQKGRYVALTNDKLIPNYQGFAQRDGAGIGRRLSAIGFDYAPSTDASFGTDFDDTALKCSGSISGTIVCKLILESSPEYTSPTNPFLHAFHPDHDNKGSDYKTFKQEVNRIVRDVTLEFDTTPRVNPDNPPPGWGVSVLGGTYTERISGLARDPIRVQGNFTLRLASDVDALNE